jgi:hypothetical protein
MTDSKQIFNVLLLLDHHSMGYMLRIMELDIDSLCGSSLVIKNDNGKKVRKKLY